MKNVFNIRSVFTRGHAIDNKTISKRQMRNRGTCFGNFDSFEVIKLLFSGQDSRDNFYVQPNRKGDMGSPCLIPIVAWVLLIKKEREEVEMHSKIQAMNWSSKPNCLRMQVRKFH